MISFEWLTVHRLRYSEPFSVPEGLPSPLPFASFWISGVSSPNGPDGLRSLRGTVFSSVGFYESEESAEQGFAARLTGLPHGDHVEEEWRGLLQAYAHRGEVNWFQSVPGCGLLSAGTDVGGTLMVITSAGYAVRDVARMADFFANVDRVTESYRAHSDNLAAETFAMFRDNNRIDGMTLSIWPSDRAMMGAAYRDGVHKQQLARHAAAPMADRTSFTRARILKSAGTWGAGDPVARLAVV